MTEPEPLQLIGTNEVRWQRRMLVHFSGCDYFRLARDPRVIAAVRAGARKIGLSVAASRLTTGNHEIYGELEAALARFFGAKTALSFSDGYLAPLAVAQSLAGEFTHALVDELSHGALMDAARMTDCVITHFRHRDPVDLRNLLMRCGKRARPIVLTDGMFSRDGSVAPLREYLKILPAHGLILVDDAHGGGVLGKTGKGSLELAGVGRGRIIQCATLSKAFGVFGGVVLASTSIRQKIVEHSRIFMGSTPLPLPLAQAALTSLKILRDEPARRTRLFENVRRLRNALRSSGWEIVDTPGPIIRLPDLSRPQIASLKKHLLAAGVFPPFLQYGAASRGIFRFVISSQHTRDQLDTLAGVLGSWK